MSLTRHYSSSVLQPEILANNLIAKTLSPFQGGKLVYSLAVGIFYFFGKFSAAAMFQSPERQGYNGWIR